MLPGGVSNQVLYVSLLERPGADFVLKQSRAQLRVPDPWHSRLDRIWREVDVLKVCQRVLATPPTGERGETPPEIEAVTPAIMFEEGELRVHHVGGAAGTRGVETAPVRGPGRRADRRRLRTPAGPLARRDLA